MEKLKSFFLHVKKQSICVRNRLISSCVVFGVIYLRQAVAIPTRLGNLNDVVNLSFPLLR